MKKLLFLICAISLYSQTLDSLLNKIEKNNDLSIATKQESAGISYVITRYQLDMMQAKYLSDVLKNTAITNNSNRYNLLDPFSLAISPFGNNNIKVFIDNYEINSMMSENGTFLFSNLPLDFVDHIEIYYFSSADKFFGEPVYAVIKLYSKNPQRDNGLNLNINYANKQNSQSIGFGSYKNNSYYLYTSKNNQKSSVNVDNKNISKNSNTYHIFAKMDNDYGNFMFNSIIDKRDAFLGISSDGKPDISEIKNKQFLIGYDRKCENVKINYTLTYQENLDYFSETQSPLFISNEYKPVYSMYTKGKNFTNNLKISFSLLNNDKTQMESGVILKNEKNFNIDYKINDKDSYNGIKNQTKYSAFFNNKYQYLSNSILNGSISYSLYDNDVVENYHLLNYKIGNTYFYNVDNIFKIFYFHMENTPPNYLVNSVFQNSTLKPTISDSITLKYKRKIDKNNNFFITYITGNSKNQIVFKNNGLENTDKDISINFVDFRWSTDYSYINNLTIEAYIMFLKNSMLRKEEQISLLNTHRYKKFDFFENLIYKELKSNKKNSGFDLDLGVNYNVNDNLTIALKGESLLSSRYENEYMRYDILNHQELTPVKTALTPKTISLNVEYSF